MEAFTFNGDTFVSYWDTVISYWNKFISYCEAYTFNNIEQALLIAAGIPFVIQMGYYVVFYSRICRRNRKTRKSKRSFINDKLPLSVIIYAPSYVKNIRENLLAILEQDYPLFEVIVICEKHGKDEPDYLAILEKQYPYLRHSFVPESSRYISHKKLAITLGIRGSKYDWIVLTDADCCPQSDQWLRLMARNFTPSTQIVLGYSGYKKRHGWLHQKIAFDNLFSSMRYLGFALGRRPYIGIGRNLAYRKSLFLKQKGFSNHLNLQQGDDDLFINKAANRYNTRVETDSRAVMRRPPVRTAKEWNEEKIGYAATSRFYRGSQKWLAGFETTTRLLFYLTWMATATVGILHARWMVAGIAVSLFLTRWIVQAIIINRTSKSLEEKRRYFFSLIIFDWLQPIQSLRWKLNCLFSDKRDFMRKPQ